MARAGLVRRMIAVCTLPRKRTSDSRDEVYRDEARLLRQRPFDEEDRWLQYGRCEATRRLVDTGISPVVGYLGRRADAGRTAKRLAFEGVARTRREADRLSLDLGRRERVRAGRQSLLREDGGANPALRCGDGSAAALTRPTPPRSRAVARWDTPRCTCGNLPIAWLYRTIRTSAVRVARADGSLRAVG